MIFQKPLIRLEIDGNQNIKNKSTMEIMEIILISLFIVCIVWQFLLLIWDIWDYSHGGKMIIDGYQRENMFKDLNRNLNSIQIPTPVNINESSTKQIVYKIDGNFNGDIKGDNVTVILMGDGNINGNINSKKGNIVLINGNVNGSVKADKVITAENQSTHKSSCDIKKEESEISNYISVHSINMKCPNCHQFINKNLRVDASVANNKIFHMMITPIFHESSYY